MSKTTKGTTNVAVKNSSIGWVVAIVAAVLFIPGLFNLGLGAAGEGAEALTKPIPGNAKRTYGDQSTPTTAAPASPRTLSSEELDARQQAKAIGDGLAKAAAEARPATPVDPRGGLPAIGQAGGGSVLGQLIPGAEGAIRAIGPGLKALSR